MLVTAESKSAKKALESVEELQSYFVEKLNGVAQKFGNSILFKKVTWLRDAGKHGGGSRYEARDEVFNRASVNVSQIHYDDDANKKLSSATAISTIIHPSNPHVPSMHMHISWTKMRDGTGYWRVMADLNPSLVYEEDKEYFENILQDASGDYYKEGSTQGDRYFYIPALERARGVSHFYLENFNRGDFEEDRAFAFSLGCKVVDAYIAIITHRLKKHTEYTKAEQERQLEYHTLYLFQVLTLDRGTTSGLLVHSQNDVGIMGSIPSHVDKELLYSWVSKMQKPQDELLLALLDTLPKERVVAVEELNKKDLANALREHYKKYPKALNMQASGNSVPPTVQNHN